MQVQEWGSRSVSVILGAVLTFLFLQKLQSSTPLLSLSLPLRTEELLFFFCSEPGDFRRFSPLSLLSSSEKLSTFKKINKKIGLHFPPLKHLGGDVIVLCFGWYCVGRAQGGPQQQPGGDQRLIPAGKSAKSGAKCGCYFLPVVTAVPILSGHPPPLHPLYPPLLPFSFTHSPYTPRSWTAPGPSHPRCRTLSLGVTHQRGGAVMTTLRHPAPAEPPSPARSLLHQVAHLQQLQSQLCWD